MVRTLSPVLRAEAADRTLPELPGRGPAAGDRTLLELPGRGGPAAAQRRLASGLLRTLGAGLLRLDPGRLAAASPPASLSPSSRSTWHGQQERAHF